MVVVPSSQPNELEQRKRKQTLERAKANHLSKQLQMRLQYAKLKVEHGWQRQNLNEVENLYFHHSHLRTMSLRQGTKQQPQYATVTQPPSAPVLVESAPSAVPDRTVAPSPSANDPCPTGPASPPSQSPLEQAPTADGRTSSQPSAQQPSLQTPAPVVPSASSPPSAFDLSDPNILARLAQLQAQVQMSTQPPSQTQTLSPPLSTTVPSTSAPAAIAQVSVPVTAPGVSHAAVGHGQPGSAYASPLPGSAPLYPIPAPSTSAPHIPPAVQPPVSVTASTAPIPTTTPIPTSAPIASTALTYDSFWSTHASSAGSTRALYRTHTGFTASATPGGNVAMLTPGGHAAVMTVEGVYVSGGSSKSG